MGKGKQATSQMEDVEMSSYRSEKSPSSHAFAHPMALKRSVPDQFVHIDTPRRMHDKPLMRGIQP